MIKKRLEKRISELEAPMLSDGDQEMVSVESSKLRSVSGALRRTHTPTHGERDALTAA